MHRTLVEGNQIIRGKDHSCNINNTCLTTAIPNPPIARWKRVNIANAAQAEQNAVFPRIFLMHVGNKSRSSCAKMRGPLIRFTFCSKSMRSSNWMVVLMLLLLGSIRQWTIRALMKVPMMSISPIINKHHLTAIIHSDSKRQHFPFCCFAVCTYPMVSPVTFYSRRFHRGHRIK